MPYKALVSWSVLKRTLLAREDALAPFRPYMARHLSPAGVVVLAPIGAWHLWHGRVALAAMIGMAVLILWLSGLVQGQRRMHVLLAVLIAALLASMSHNGIEAMLWAYPALFVCHAVVAQRAANLFALVLVIGTTAQSALFISGSVSVRVAATMMLILTIINLMLTVIGELQRSLQREAVTDPLTGSLNRREFDRQLRQLTAAGSALAPASALVMIDIDHFKSINDRHGHAVGDEVLQHVAVLIRSQARAHDALFRIGGEEFVLLLADCDAQAALRVAQFVRESIVGAVLLPDAQVTVSIGVSVRQARETEQAWLQRADAAMYAAKGAGRNRVVLASPQEQLAKPPVAAAEGPPAKRARLDAVS